MEHKNRGMHYEDRRPYNSGRNKAFDRDRQRGRRRRRRQRLLKALAAWAVCLLLVALVAFGTFRAVTYFTSSRQRQLRSQGIEQMEQGNYQEAIQSFDQALEAIGRDTGSMAEDILCYRAEAEFGLGDYQAALYTYSLLTEREPEEPDYYYMSSICSSALEEPVQAAQAYSQGLAQKGGADSPVRLNALLSVGSACVSAGEYEQAMTFYSQAVEEGLDDGQIYNQMGLCQMAQEKYEDAADTFDQTIQRERETQSETGENSLLRELTFNRAVCSEYMQQYAEALELFQAYVQEFGPDEQADHEIAFLESRQ